MNITQWPSMQQASRQPSRKGCKKIDVESMGCVGNGPVGLVAGGQIASSSEEEALTRGRSASEECQDKVVEDGNGQKGGKKQYHSSQETPTVDLPASDFLNASHLRHPSFATLPGLVRNALYGIGCHYRAQGFSATQRRVNLPTDSECQKVGGGFCELLIAA